MLSLFDLEYIQHGANMYSNSYSISSEVQNCYLSFSSDFTFTIIQSPNYERLLLKNIF